MLLAIDTSTVFTGLACWDKSGLLGECVWDSGRNHSVQVLPQIDMLLHHIGHVPSDVAVVGVAIGPGSWSGLRVGMSIAKGLAVAGDVPVVGICTLDALAYQHQHLSLPVYPLIRLGRERFATALFQHEGTWQRLSDYRNVSLPELCADVREQPFFCGDIDAHVQQQMQQCIDGPSYFAYAVDNVRRPGYLADLAWQRFVAGDCDDVMTLEPLYLGEPVKKP